MKRLLKIVTIAALAVVLLFLAGRYGWRMFGFALCDAPDANYVETVTVENGSVWIDGGTFDSFSSYVGCVSRIEGDRLYVGVKHNLFLGFFRRIGAFSIAVDADGQPVSSVCFTDGSTERLIWTQADDVIRSDPQQSASGSDSSDASDAVDDPVVQASYPFDAADGENDLCAVLFLGYDEASADEAVARLCSAYEVLHELFLAGDVLLFDANGAEQYLIVPKYAGTTITVTEVQMDDHGDLLPVGSPVSTGSIVRIFANYSDIIPSVQVTVQYGDRSVTFNPFISLKDGIISDIDGAYTAMY